MNNTLPNTAERKLISVCIPTFEMHGLGPKFLKESFDILAGQTFKDFDVVVSDESKTDVIRVVCDEYANKLDIKYHKNIHGARQFAPNTNYAIQMATGKIIKILLLDDFLYTNTALEEIANGFDLNRDSWLVTACIQTKDNINFFRPFYPRYNDETILFKNTISSPSVVTIKNDNPLLFDTNMLWFVDLDYYKRCFQKFGVPKILNKINVVNRLGEHQATNTTATEDLREKEFRYILKKYKIKNAYLRRITYKYRRCEKWAKSMIKKILGIKNS